jgi:LacI family transcriptional regulator
MLKCVRALSHIRYSYRLITITTIRDVAKAAGVSQATASRVAGKYGYVSAKNRQKVLKAIRDLSYRPNRIARSMVTKSTQTVGLVVTDIQNPFFAELARGIEEVAWAHGYTLILANTDESLERESAILTVLQEKMVDGLILVPASSRPSDTRTALNNQGIPVVLLDRASADLDVDTVLVDNENAAYQAVSYLIGLGHKRIGMIVDSLEITTNEERLAGYRSAMYDHGLPIEKDLLQPCLYTRESAYEITREMLKMPDRPTALFTAFNFISIGALRAIQEAGLQIPRDISMVGFDEVDSNHLNYPQLTVVVQPVSDMARVAGERLIARLQGDKTMAQEIRLKTKFVLRESCRPAGDLGIVGMAEQV